MKKIVGVVVVTVLLGWLASDVAGNGLLARLNGRTIQTIHFQSNTDWSDYCHPYRPSSSSLINTFSVVCRSLGYEGYLTSSNLNYGRTITKTNRLYFINCAGTESSLEECSVSFTSSRSCYYYYQVTCRQCAVGSVRLTGGIIPQQGHVEVCLNGSWSRVCSSSWSQRDAVVACRQLNFPVSELSYSTSTTYELQNAGFIASSRLYNCYGNESRLIDCKYSTSTSCLSRAVQGYYYYPTLHCKGDLAMTGCTSGSLRLNGGSENEGNLQICTNGTWLQVIYSNWDSLDGEVACRELGLLHSGGTKITWTYTSHFIPRSPLGFRCVGSERRLQDCPYSVTTSHSSGVYLRCQTLPQSRETCRGEGQVRLVNGSIPNEGRLEICIQGVWGSICHDSWDSSESAIVCEQLGFQSENSTAISSRIYGDGNKPIVLSDLYCSSESSLLQCRRRSRSPGYHSCLGLEGNAVAVRCDDSTCRHGDIRLYGGYVSFEGTPEICINGQWAYACSSNWDSSDSTVFCRQFLNVQNVRAISSTSARLRNYPRSRTRINNVACSLSSSSSIFTTACSYSVGIFSCSHISVGCYVPGCTSGSVRIVPVSSSNDGVVEVCQDSVWGSISSSSWDYRDARVICKELGQPWQRSLASFDSRQSPMVWHRLSCSGYENSISNCRFSSKYSISTSTTYNPILYRYPHYSAAAVICRGNDSGISSSRCTKGAIRLANKTQTSTLLKGRLEVCDDGEWKVVCYSGYSLTRQTDLVLACSHIIGSLSRVSYRYESSGDSATQGIMSSLNCPSRAQNIISCSPRYTDFRYCRTTSLVGISCEATDMAYEVQVNSMTSDGSYELGSSANFSCSISPTPTISPPNSLIYYWTIPGISSTRSTLSSTNTFDIGYHYPKLNVIHCEVRYSSGYIFGTGHLFFKVKNAIQVIDGNSYQTSNGSTYIEVDIANTTLYTNSMSELAWYHNDYLVSRVSNLVISDGMKSLQTHGNPGGDYKVRFEGFLIVPYDRACEKSLLDALDKYPAFQGAQISFTQQDNNGPENRMLSVSTNHGSSSPVLYTVNETVTVNFAVDLSHDYDQYFGKAYFLRVYNERGSSLYSTSISNTDYWSGAFTMSNSLTLNSALIKIVLFSTYSSEFRSKCESYYSLIRPLLSYSSVIQDQYFLKINYYENLSHSFSADKYDYYYTESTNISCNGSIDIPLFRAVSISKGNVTLIESETGTVKFSTSSLNSPQQYGVYTCTLYARKGVKFIKEIHLKNQVRVGVELDFVQVAVCQDNEAYMKKMVSDFTRVLHQLCNCAINSSHISNATLSCPGSSSSHGILNATLTYSNDNGSITATSVAQILYAATLAQTRNVVIGEDITIGSVRFTNGSTFDINNSQEANGQSKSTAAIVGVGTFVSGVLLTLLCLGIVVAIIGCTRKYKSTRYGVPNPSVSYNNNKETKYTAGPKSSRTTRKSTIEALTYEEPVEQPQPLPTAIAQPLYEDIDHFQKDIVMSPNVGYEEVSLSRM